MRSWASIIARTGRAQARNRIDDQIVDIVRPHVGAVARVGRDLAHDAIGRPAHQRQQRGVLLVHRHLQPGWPDRSALGFGYQARHSTQATIRTAIRESSLEPRESESAMLVSRSESRCTRNLECRTDSAVAVESEVDVGGTKRVRNALSDSDDWMFFDARLWTRNSSSVRNRIVRAAAFPSLKAKQAGGTHDTFSPCRRSRPR